MSLLDILLKICCVNQKLNITLYPSGKTKFYTKRDGMWKISCTLTRANFERKDDSNIWLIIYLKQNFFLLCLGATLKLSKFWMPTPFRLIPVSVHGVSCLIIINSQLPDGYHFTWQVKEVKLKSGYRRT